MFDIILGFSHDIFRFCRNEELVFSNNAIPKQLGSYRNKTSQTLQLDFEDLTPNNKDETVWGLCWHHSFWVLSPKHKTFDLHSKTPTTHVP